nr:hypothetical protein [uncultured Kingella sp.]
MENSLTVRQFVEAQKFQDYLNEFVRTHNIKMMEDELSSQGCNLLAGALNAAGLDLAAIEQKLDADKDFLFKFAKIADKQSEHEQGYMGFAPLVLIYCALTCHFLNQSEQALAEHYKKRGYKGHKKLAKRDFETYSEAKRYSPPAQ